MKVELKALTQVLNQKKRSKASNYTESRYFFAMAHVHGSIYQKRELLTAVGKTIKNKEEKLALLEALWLPLKVDIILCPGHQRRT
jgi:CII-binding regulator of phage lambda lysogenization HflD